MKEEEAEAEEDGGQSLEGASSHLLAERVRLATVDGVPKS